MSSQPSGRSTDTRDAAGTGPGARPGRRRYRVALPLVAAVVVAGVVVAVALQLRPGGAGTSPAASGVPANVPSTVGNLMQLGPAPGQQAPGFTLTDQYGHTVSLAGFRGRPVVLEFMDPHCTDICPIVSQEFVDAARDLGAAARHVVFLAVNVNRYHLGVSDVAAFSSGHGLDQIATWHFVTGSYRALRSVWRAYGIAVDAPGPNADVVHTSVVFFIGPDGRERYVAWPTDDHRADGAAYLPGAQLTSWGRGIALVARDLSA
ncbi:MAG: SCO family protein [Acidimicrobiales bacterium]